MSEYKPTIGIECHVQLSTKTKLFSAANNDARDQEPNSCVSHIDYALPGMLPLLNEEAISLAIKAGLALNSEINLISRFDRKHYFYPDLPKGYQISQLYQPIIGAGSISLPDGSIVHIEHAHLEEDAGKLTHQGNYSLVDLNRAGTPLIEIVSMPDIHSPEQARDYCKELWRLMTYAGVTLGDLYQGNMRFDVNISVSKTDELGTRAEIKNLNSFRSVERAAAYEFTRQVELLEKGEKVKQETRGWDDAKGKTTSQRSKEEAQDYRYMPDPDIPPVKLTIDQIESTRSKLPTMPAAYREKFSNIIPLKSLEILLDYQPLIILLDQIYAKTTPEIFTKLWPIFTNVLLAEENTSLLNDPLPSTDQLINLGQMLTENQLSSTAAKSVFLKFFDPEMREKPTDVIAKELNLLQVSDTNELQKIVDTVLSNPAASAAFEDVKNGEEKAIGFLIGLIMKESKGKANPSLARELIKERINNDKL